MPMVPGPVGTGMAVGCWVLTVLVLVNEAASQPGMNGSGWGPRMASNWSEPKPSILVEGPAPSSGFMVFVSFGIPMIRPEERKKMASQLFVFLFRIFLDSFIFLRFQ